MSSFESSVRAAATLAALLTAGAARAQHSSAAPSPAGSAATEIRRSPGDVLRQERIAFEFLPLSAVDRFGSSLCSVGDLDGDGIGDIAVGTPRDNIPNLIGSAWVVYLDGQGKERDWAYLAPPRPIPAGQFGLGDQFGSALACLGDLDGDGAVELAVGAPTFGTDPLQGVGKVWILSLESDGTIRAQHAITEGEAGFGEHLEYTDLFGNSLAALGDIDGDGVGDLAVGALHDVVASARTGSVRILLLNPDATVKAVTTIAAGLGGFTGTLAVNDEFGSAVAGIGDLDGDGLRDLAVGAQNDVQGSVWILFLNADGSVRTHTKMVAVATTEAFGAALDSFDLEGDGLLELLVGAPEDHEVTANTGATFIVTVDSSGSVLANTKLSHRNGGMVGIRGGDVFGSAIAAAGDIDGDGLQDLFVGSPLNENTPCLDVGVTYRLLLDANGEVADQYEMGGRCLGEERFGASAVEIGDLTGDGKPEFAIGMPGPGSTSSIGSVSFFSPEGSSEPLLTLFPDTTTTTPTGFGTSLAAPGDINGDGRPDLVVGAPDSERIYVFLLDPGGAVRTQRTFLSGLPSGRFTESLVALDDLDGDGRRELAAGMPNYQLDPGGRQQAGAIVIVSVNADGTKRSTLLISEVLGGFTGYLPRYEHFGSALAWLGDMDGDGFGELAVGAPSDAEQAPLEGGSVWILSLAPDGTVVRELQIGYGLAGFGGPLANGDRFGAGLVAAGDLDDDGVGELVVGAPGDDDGGADHGALWVLLLRSDGMVRAARKLSEETRQLGRLLGGADFGRSLAVMPLLNGLSQVGLFVGAPLDDRVARDAGAAWTLVLHRR